MQTQTQTDIATYRLNLPRGRLIDKQHFCSNLPLDSRTWSNLEIREILKLEGVILRVFIVERLLCKTYLVVRN